MDDAQKERLSKHGVLVLPGHIEKDVYELVLDACLLRPDKRIILHCRGDGGEFATALGVVALLEEHGQFVGVLAGEALSAHATIFAGCSERFVYPRAAIGLHSITVTPNQSMTANDMLTRADELNRDDSQTAVLLAAASNLNKLHWLNIIQTHGVASWHYVSAEEMVRIGMARPVADMQPVAPAGANGHAETD